MKQILSSFPPCDTADDRFAKDETLVTGSSSDAQLEDRINLQARLLREDRSPDENRATWLELTRLHAMRTPQRIAEMEGEAGLR